MNPVVCWSVRSVVLALSFCLALLGCGQAWPGRGGSFPERWIDGTDSDEPAFQVHLYARDSWIIRQSLLTHVEAPFLYLLKGAKEALLLDSGAPAEVDLRGLVDHLIGPEFPLIVAHSHGHGDHIAGDQQFESRANTRIVGHSAQQVASFFAISGWPDLIVDYDLGGRSLSLIPIPGHEPASLAIFDPPTGLLLTGDTLYPGRLYVRDREAYRASIDRLIAFSRGREVRWLVGTHIEMTQRPGVDFPLDAPSHPQERALELPVASLEVLRAMLNEMGASQERFSGDDFIIVPLP